MLGKLRNVFGIAEKAPHGRQISSIGYSEKLSRLVIEFTDGSMHTHLNVIEGHIVGLRIAENKLDFYESQIEPLNTALEVRGVTEGSGTVVELDTGTRAAVTPEKRGAQR